MFWGSVYIEYFESCDFSRENTNIEVSVFYVRFKDDKHVIWMW
jgi:NurA-like 5'-3' nuclease